MLKQMIKTLTICAVAILVMNQPATAQINEFKITAADGAANDEFGYSVSISGDYAIVGANGDDDDGNRSGSAYVFFRDGESWTEQVKLTASDGGMLDYFGISVSITGDYAIVGARMGNDGRGSAYIFVRDGQSWTEQAKLTASDGGTNDNFGISVSISGSYAIVGAYMEGDNMEFSGSAYVFFRDGESWTEQVKLTASDIFWYDNFGISVSISEDYAVVGADGDDDNGDNSGSAYVFKRSGTSWAQEAKLLAADGAGYDWFGHSVSNSGDYAVVGAYGDDGSGSAYVFKHSGTSWVQEAKLLAADGAAGEWFGYSVSISGDYTVIGARQGENNGYNSGSAYVFKRNGTSWLQEAKLIASDGVAVDWFGHSVSNSGDYAVVGAVLDDDNGESSGSAYVFSGLTPIGVLSVAPDSLDFGDVVVGGTTTEHVTVSNIGTDDLNVTGNSITGDNVANFSIDMTPFTLTPGENRLLDVSFTPDTADDFHASLSISSDVGNVSVDLIGTGATPEIFVSPLSVDFGDVLIGETATEQVTVKNSGTVDLNVSDFMFTGSDSLSFSIDNTSFTLTPGDSSILSVLFTPDTSGIFNGSLSIDSDGGSASVSLIGNGIAPEIFVTPSSIDFSDVLIGETATEHVMVLNIGTADLNVSLISFTGDDSPNFNTDTTHFLLALGDSLYLEVSFNPNTSGNFNASMVIESDGGTVTVSLSGHGINPAPSIISISDVPDDQGGWVFLTWESSMFDTVGDITQYGVWELNSKDELVSLGNVPAIQGDDYTYVAHTFGDSTDEGIFWSMFMVTAHTTDPEVFYTSMVDSGYSVDNLAPTVPTGLLALVTEENTVVLTWDPPIDEDFNYFKIYRSLTPDFDPTGMEPFAETVETTFIDSDVEIGETYYYILSAVDFNGNESNFSEEESAEVLSLDEFAGIPDVFALRQNYPNPFNPITTLRYDLPEDSFVNINVYDMLGREVKTLVNQSLEAGYKTVIWDATNDHGKPVSAGVYLYQIHAGEYVQTKKMVLLK